MKKQNSISKNLFFCVFLRLLPRKRMNNTIWRNITTLTKREFSVFFTLLVTKTPKCMQILLYVDINDITSNVSWEIEFHYQKTSFQMFFTLLGPKKRVRHKKKAKYYRKLPIWETKTTLTKMCLLSVFKLLTYENVKTPAKHLLLRNITVTKKFTTLPKRCIMGVLLLLFFFLLMTHKTLKATKNERTLRET